MPILQKIIEDGEERSSAGEVASARELLERLLAKKAQAEKLEETIIIPYYQIVPKDLDWVKWRAAFANLDDIYEYLQPLTNWLMQRASLFTDCEAWRRMVQRSDTKPDRGLITISGFRRPDVLKVFSRVTIMSALFQHTILYDFWKELGVRFVPSSLIRMDTPTTPLGSRTLRIYWLTDQGWSKRMRDRAGGIEAIFNLIKQSGIISEAETTCVVTNKDDASEDDPRVVQHHFRN